MEQIQHVSCYTPEWNQTKVLHTRIRGQQFQQMYEWTTHAINLSKGIKDTLERNQQARCKLCGKSSPHINNVHTC